MSKKKNAALLCAGMLAGIVLGGPAANAVSNILAERSVQPIYVDGTQVQMEAYVINGNNYVKLRDIGKAVDFGVAYDAGTNSVRIDSASPYVEEVKPTPAPADGVIVVPQSDAPFRPLKGDVVQLDDGTTFTVTEPKDEEPPLPTLTYDLSLFPELELPKVRTTAWHEGQAAGTVGILNLYETRRMQYTIYNAVPNCPELWADGTLKLSSKGNPILRLQLGITDPTAVQPFWPWRDNQLTQVFYSAPMAQFAVEAWDTYKNGKFLYTCYYVQGL